MKKPIRIPSLLLSLLLVTLWLAVPVNGSGYDNVLRVSDGKTIGLEQLIDETKGADLVFVGEEHNNLRHHHFQLDVIKALYARKVPLAVGIEMFRAGSQKELDLWVSGELTTGAFIRIYNNNWGRIPWPGYKNIFIYAKNYDLPMIGLNIPDAITTRISRSGFSSLTEEERKQLPPDLSCEINERYREHIRKAYLAYSGHSTSFENFAEAQMVWDASMALYLVDFFKRTPGKTVVVIAGTGHTDKKGIPEQIRKYSKLSSIVILPEIPGRIDRGSIKIEDADYLLLKESGSDAAQ